MNYEIKVTRENYGWGEVYGQWKAMEKDGDEDYDLVGDSWQYCGSPRGFGSSIQEAIENLIDNLFEKGTMETIEEIKYKWS